MKNPMIITIILVVVIGVGAFFAGTQYQKGQRSNFSQFNGQNRAGQTMRRLGNGNGNFAPVRGEIISSDDKSVTVKMPDGSSKIVLLGGNTSISEATATSKESLKAGEQVVVFGSENSDGSVTAQTIQLNPQLRQLDNSNNTNR